jgi:hexosaminidase
MPVAGQHQAGPLKETLRIETPGRSARYIQVRASNLGRLPDGHPAAGQKAWLFVDEIMINPTRP